MKSDAEKVADIIRAAGGNVVGRTRLQKMTYLLELAGVGEGFYFDYHHYGPYCEELTLATETARILGLVVEKEKRAAWGGIYSEYSLSQNVDASQDSIRTQLARISAKANSIVLELAATAAYFAKNGEADPWGETARRKPDKAANGRIEEAKNLYRELCLISDKLPKISS